MITRKTLFILTVMSLVSYSCKVNKDLQGDDTESLTEEKAERPRTITIKGLYTEEYCGGAEPEESVLEAMSQARPYADRTVYIYSGLFGESDFYKGKTNKNGEIKLRLTNGNYTLFATDVEGLNKALENARDQGHRMCLEQQLKMPMGGFQVVPGVDTAQFVLNIMCDPCEPPRP